MLQRKCSQCTQEKPFSDFYQNKARKDKHCTICITCMKTQGRAYREQNREELIAKGKEWKNRNPERLKEWQKEYRKKNAERIREYDRERSVRRRAEKNEANRERYKADPEYRESRQKLTREQYWKDVEKSRLRNKLKRQLKPELYAAIKSKAQRNQHLKKSYGITVKDYERMVTEQRGMCAICGEVPSGNKQMGKLHVDHCHKTGQLRSLLCHHCNRALGNFRDDPMIMLKAIRYIRRHI